MFISISFLASVYVTIKLTKYMSSLEDPNSRSPQFSYGVDYGTLRWIYFLDPTTVRGPYFRSLQRR